mgnify:CR=1 FL=1
MNKTVKNIIIRVSMLIGVAAFIFLIIMAKTNRAQNTVKNIVVNIDEWNGNFFVTKSQVLALVNKNFDILGKTLSGKDLEKIEQSLSVIPQVQKANAFLDNKGALTIKVDQRIPLFRVYNALGESFYVDENGIKFPVTENYAAKVPVATGLIIEPCYKNQKVQGKQLKSIFKLIQEFKKNQLWNSLIGQININEKLQIELIPRIANATIIFGDDQNIEQKLKRLDVFYFEVLQKVGWDRYKVINIMYKDQVVCLK